MRGRGWMLLLALVGNPATASAAALPPPSQRVLRVCADPDNLPLSNRVGEGLENRLVQLVAAQLGARVETIWWPQRRGYLRNTLNAGRCDVVPGIASGVPGIGTTAPWYRSTYVFVTRVADGPKIDSLDDPRLRRLRIGVQLVGDDGANTPPAHSLSRRGIVTNVRGFPIYGEEGGEPQLAIFRALARKDIDVALAWGPVAGYYANRVEVPLQVAAVEPWLDGPQWPMVFDISMGVRKQDVALRRELDRVLVAIEPQVQALLREYRVPLVQDPR